MRVGWNDYSREPALQVQRAALEIEVREKEVMMSYSRQLGRGRDHWLHFGYTASKSHENLNGGMLPGSVSKEAE